MAKYRRSKRAPPKSAIAPIGAKFHGCGITRRTTPTITRVRASQKRALKIVRIFVLLSARDGVADSEERAARRRWKSEDFLVARVGQVLDLRVRRDRAHLPAQRQIS